MIFLPYDLTDIISFFSDKFSLDLSSLSNFESSLVLILSNAYFFVFWFFIIYFSLKGLNWVYERIF